MHDGIDKITQKSGKWEEKTENTHWHTHARFNFDYVRYKRKLDRPLNTEIKLQIEFRAVKLVI